MIGKMYCMHMYTYLLTVYRDLQKIQFDISIKESYSNKNCKCLKHENSTYTVEIKIKVSATYKMRQKH